MATYKSLESLKAAILKEVRSAVDAAAQESKNVLQKNVDEFYSIPEGRYHRIGMLQAAPQLDSVFETKNGAMAQISINTGTQYDPAGRDTETIYGYRVEDMDTSTDEGKALAEAIEQYQSWYEKAQDCKQAVVDLRNEQQKLFEQWANMPTEAAEKKIDRLTTGYNGINAVSSRLTAATKGGSTQAALAETMKSDLTDAENQKKADNKTLKAAKTANKKASTAKKKANNKVKSTAKSLLKTNLTDEQKKQVQAGKKIDSTGMSGSQKKKADAYNKAVTNKTKANKKATSAKSKLSTAKSNYNSSNSTYKSMKSNVNTALNAYDSGNSLSYMNGLVDEQVSGKKSEQEARKKAVEQANANVTTAKNQKTAADKKLANLQKKYKNSKTLTAHRKRKWQLVRQIDTTGITEHETVEDSECLQ